MGIETDADRLALVEGHESVIWKSGTDSKTVLGLFESPYVATDAGQLEADNRDVSFLCRSCDVSGAVAGDTVIYDGTTYEVVGVEADGQGMTLLVLGGA